MIHTVKFGLLRFLTEKFSLKEQKRILSPRNLLLLLVCLSVHKAWLHERLILIKESEDTKRKHKTSKLSHLRDNEQPLLKTSSEKADFLVLQLKFND